MRYWRRSCFGPGSKCYGTQSKVIGRQDAYNRIPELVDDIPGWKGHEHAAETQDERTSCGEPLSYCGGRPSGNLDVIEHRQKLNSSKYAALKNS